jgi:predicted transcriptional regulator
MLTKQSGEKLVERYMEENSLTNELMVVVECVKNKITNSIKKNRKMNNKKEMKKPPTQQNESVVPRQLDAVLCGSKYHNSIFFHKFANNYCPCKS